MVIYWGSPQSKSHVGGRCVSGYIVICSAFIHVAFVEFNGHFHMVIGSELMQTVVSVEPRFSRGLRSLQFM